MVQKVLSATIRAVPPGGGGLRLLFMFSRKIIIKLFKIAPENFQTHT
jgi:hypothetical protein